MNLSIYDDGGTLGGVDNSRVVVLSGTTTVSQWFSPNFFEVDQWLRRGLENRGFSVIAVRMSAAGWVGYANNVEIELNVFNNFTSEEARVNAIQAINDITANYGLNRVFSNTTLSVTSDGGGGGGGGATPSAYDKTRDRDKDKGPGSTTLLVIGAAAALLMIVMIKR